MKTYFLTVYKIERKYVISGLFRNKFVFKSQLRLSTLQKLPCATESYSLSHSLNIPEKIYLCLSCSISYKTYFLLTFDREFLLLWYKLSYRFRKRQAPVNIYTTYVELNYFYSIRKLHLDWPRLSARLSLIFFIENLQLLKLKYHTFYMYPTWFTKWFIAIFAITRFD